MPVFCFTHVVCSSFSSSHANIPLQQTTRATSLAAICGADATEAEGSVTDDATDEWTSEGVEALAGDDLDAIAFCTPLRGGTERTGKAEVL